MKKQNLIRLNKAVKELEVRKAFVTNVTSRIEELIGIERSHECYKDVESIILSVVKDNIYELIAKGRIRLSEIDEKYIDASVDEFFDYLKDSGIYDIIRGTTNIIVIFHQIGKGLGNGVALVEKAVSILDVIKHNKKALNGDFALLDELTKMVAMAKVYASIQESQTRDFANGGIIYGGEEKEAVIDATESIINKRKAHVNVLNQLQSISKEAGHDFDTKAAQANFEKLSEGFNVFDGKADANMKFITLVASKEEVNNTISDLQDLIISLLSSNPVPSSHIEKINQHISEIKEFIEVPF